MEPNVALQMARLHSSMAFDSNDLSMPFVYPDPLDQAGQFRTHCDGLLAASLAAALGTCRKIQLNGFSWKDSISSEQIYQKPNLKIGNLRNGPDFK